MRQFILINNAADRLLIKRFATSRPPTYKEQVAQGVPFGKRKIHGREQQIALQAVVGEKCSPAKQ